MLNYYVIIAKSFTVIDIAKDFIALMVISDFDNFFYEEHSKSQSAKKVVTEKDDAYQELFKVSVTTSRDAYELSGNPDFNKFEPLAASVWIEKVWSEIETIDGEREDYRLLKPDHIKITKRTCLNRVLFKVYQFLRFLYVGFWFYFSPFFFSTIQFILPFYVLQRDGKLPEEPEEEPECPA